MINTEKNNFKLKENLLNLFEKLQNFKDAYEQDQKSIFFGTLKSNHKSLIKR